MDIKQLYTDIILEYNQDLTNKRELVSPTIKEHGHNPNCGDDIDVAIKVREGMVEDIAYTGNGCAISQASTAMMAELIKGKSLMESRRLVQLFLAMLRGQVTDVNILEELEAAYTLKDIAKMPVRVKCAVLGWHTLELILNQLSDEDKRDL